MEIVVDKDKKKRVLKKQSLGFKLLRLLFIGKEFEDETIELNDNLLIRTIVPFHAEDGQRQYQIIDLNNIKIEHNPEKEYFSFNGEIKVAECFEDEDFFEQGETDSLELKIYDYFTPGLKEVFDQRSVFYKLEK